MKEMIQSVRAFFRAVGNYLSSVWNRALEVLSMRAEPVGQTDALPVSAKYAEFGAKQRKRTFFGGPYGWRVLNRRLERGRSGTHRPEWRSGKD